MTDINDVDKRLIVVEVQFENLKENLKQEFQQMGTKNQETFNLVFGLKERLDKQNGLLPHMADEVNQISSRVDLLSANFNQYTASKAKVSVQPKESSGKGSAAKWTAIGAIVMGILEVIRIFVLQ